MTTQEIVFEEIAEENCPLFDKLELIWKESTSVQSIVDHLKTISLFAMKTTNLKMKRTVVMMMSGKFLNNI